MFLSKKTQQFKQRMVRKQQQLAVMVVIAASSQLAHAGGDASFQDTVDWLMGLLQGSLGGLIVLTAILICAIALTMGGWKTLSIVLGVIFDLIVLPAPVMSYFTATF